MTTEQKKLQAEFDTLKDRRHINNNHERRILFADTELFRIKIETHSSIDDIYREQQISDINDLQKSITLKKENHFWYDSIDRLICGIAGWIWLLTCTIFLCPPVMCLNPIETFLVKYKLLSVRNQPTDYIRAFIANTMLLLSGTDLIIKDLDTNVFSHSNCPLVCFSHGSTLDAFVLGSMIPIRQNSLAKKELFLVPFLNLLLHTFGVIAIDRKDRNAAVTVIQRATKNAETGGCILVAPEGTRSKTGHLLPFKKGPFYLWETLQSTIIPIVIIGAFELCPPG